MGMFDWSSEYSVGLSTVDREHQNLFKIAAELHSAMLSGRSEPVLLQCLERLVRYTLIHFAHEERLMERCGYPDLEAHKAQHQALAARVLGFQAEFQRGRMLPTELLAFLKSWLVAHIRGADTQYVPFLKQESAA